jgi:diguanylate cyclase (GGDEF)-like protein/putative nucleotidyltransferase with HDIG domain
MNLYTLFPLIATFAYIPLLATTASSRPWQKRHLLFILFLVSAMLWSGVDYIFRSQFFLQQAPLLFKFIIIAYALMAVQFHCFTSSFFAPGQRRWLPFAYVSLITTVVIVMLGYATGGVVVRDAVVHGIYRIGILFVFLPLMSLAARNLYVFGKRLKAIDNPVTNNQIVSLMLGISVLMIFTLTAFLPWGKEYPLGHLGNIINAFILSYAVIRHRLIDIRLVLRQGSALLSLAMIGVITYWLLLVVLHVVFNFALDLTASFVATMAGLLVGAFVYRLRGSLFEAMSRIFQGPSYDNRLKLSEFANSIYNVFSLKGQGGEFLALLTRAIGIKQTCLLFPEAGSGDFKMQFAEPAGPENKLKNLEIKGGSPIVTYLERERKLLTREHLDILPEFLGLWTKEKGDSKAFDVEFFIPLISRDRLIAILVLGKKQTGRYSLEDVHLLEDVTSRVAVSMEKEYLSEQLREREQELSVINNCGAVITSSLDIQEIYGSFIEELKKLINVTWAAIVLEQDNALSFIALSSEIGTDWRVGEKVPLSGSGTEWVINNKKSIYEPDLTQASMFATVSRYIQWGLHSVVHLPLIAKGEAIGSFIVASRQVSAYTQRNIKLLEQLAAQIAMPVENARLYAQAEKKARIDELTGLLNRRSLDEMIDAEVSRHSRYGGIFSLAILDLDSFKLFNDNYGHLAGDKLLRQVGRIIRSAIRGSDLAFRYGGDEFAILLPQTTVDAARQVLERVRQRIASKAENSEIHITASIGLASWPADGISKNEVIAAADAALYRAKRSGGNQCHMASGSLLPLDGVDSGAGIIDSRTLGIIYTLAETVDSKVTFTSSHSKKVTECALALAEAMKLETADVTRLETCALLHDIGKIGISNELLCKPDKLTAEEWEIIKTHPQLGASIISHIPQLAHCKAGILYHHERYDGSGYPEKLKGEEIPLDARILAIADAFSAMTSDRPYMTALSTEAALEEISRGAGTQFDPQLAKKFISIWEKHFAATMEKDVRR